MSSRTVAVLALPLLALFLNACGGGDDELADGTDDGLAAAAAATCAPTDEKPTCPAPGLYPACSTPPTQTFACKGKTRQGLSVLICYNPTPGIWIAGCSTPPAPGAAPMNCYWGCP